MSKGAVWKVTIVMEDNNWMPHNTEEDVVEHWTTYLEERFNIWLDKLHVEAEKIE